MLIRLGATPITNSNDLLDALDLKREANEPSVQTIPFDSSPEEKEILELLSEPKTKDEIVEILKRAPEKINSILSLLEIKGLIVEKMGEIRRS